MEQHTSTPLETGYVEVELQVDGKTINLWQAVDQGSVTAYYDTEGHEFDLPDIYEMRVLDGEVTAKMQGKSAV